MNGTQLRLALAGATATLLSALTLVPLVADPGWLAAASVEVAVIVGTGGFARRFGLPWSLVVLGQLVLATVTIVGLFARQTALWGLMPGPEALARFQELLAEGLAVTRREAAPVTGTPGVILLLTAGLAVVALLVDLIAVSARKPAAAGLPLLAVYCVPAAVLHGGLPWGYFLIAAAGYLTLLGADCVDRLRQWGRVLGPQDGRSRRPALGGPLFGVPALAAGCLLAAVVLPALVPGLDHQLLTGAGAGAGSGRGGSISVINPILDLRANLTAPTDTVVLRYRTTTSSPQPLRIVSDDVFDGNQWSPQTGSIPRDNRVQTGLPTAPGLAASTATRRLTTQIQSLDLRQTYLPLPYPSTKVDIDGPWLYDAPTLNVVGDGVTTQNLAYTAEHLDVMPTPAQLAAAPAPPQPVLSQFTRLPSTLPRQIAGTARAVAGDHDAYQQAVALQQWLRSGGGFRYDPTVLPPQGRGDGGYDAVLAFLRTKQGYCVQFASAMAVMARSLGIPARVAVGFLPGTPGPDGGYEISVRDAHAWPELYFQTVGWVRFEPTPGTRSGPPPAWAAPHPAAVRRQPDRTPTQTPTTPRTRPTTSTRQEQPAPPASPRNTPPVSGQGLLPAAGRALGVVLLVLLLAAVPVISARTATWLRWRRAERRSATAVVEAAWEELRQRLADLGVTWASSWTAQTLQARLVQEHAVTGAAHGALERLVTDLENMLYAPPGTPTRQAAAVRADLDAVIEAVRTCGTVSAWTRRRARWLPGSGLRAARGAWHRADHAPAHRVDGARSGGRDLVGRR